MGDRLAMSRGLAAVVVICAMVLVGAGSAQGQVSFDRAFGVGVATGVAAFENCTTSSTCQAGAFSGAAGGMTFPLGVAVDAQGRILVADRNHRIARFVVAGDGTVAFDRAFGIDVDPGGVAGFENCTTASGCQAGTPSGDAGGMAFPFGVAVDGQGGILVADTLNSRIARFVVAGDGTVAFDRAFGIGVETGVPVAFENCTTASGCQSGAPSGAAGGMNQSAGVAVDAQGRILVADFINHRIDRFVVAGDGTVAFDRAFGIGVETGGSAFENCTTASTCQPGTASGAAGGMDGPFGVAVDGQGRILVADQNNHRIARYVMAGDGTVAFDRAFGIGVDSGVAAFENCTTASTCQAGAPSGAAGGMTFPFGVAVDGQGRILVAGNVNGRIDRFVVAEDGTVAFDRAFGIGVDTGLAVLENCTTASTCQVGAPSGAAGGMIGPAGVAVDAQGRILVADFGSNRVDRFISVDPAVPALTTWALAVLTLTLLGFGARRMSRSRATPSS